MLLHVKSNRMLTFKKKIVKSTGLSTVHVFLKENGGEGSWLCVRPFHKHRQNGDPVLVDDRVLLTSVRTGHALNIHVVEDGNIKPRFEIDGMLGSQMSWRINLYLLYTDNMDTVLKGGDVIRLYHLESERFLTGDDYEGYKAFLRTTCRVTASAATSSKALWEIEVVHQDQRRTEVGRWNSFYRLKHLASGLYLAGQADSIQPDTAIASSCQPTAGEINNFLVLTPHPTADTVFELEPTKFVQSLNSLVPNSTVVRLKHVKSSTWVQSTPIPIDSAEEKPIMHKLQCSSTRRDNETFSIIPVSSEVVRELDFANDAIKELNYQAWLFESGTISSAQCKSLASILAQICQFLVMANSLNQTDVFHLFEELSPSRERQKLLRELNILEQIFRILRSQLIGSLKPIEHGKEVVIPSYPWSYEEDSCYDFIVQRCNTRRQPQNKEHFGIGHDEVRYIGALCYRVLNGSQKGYRKNQVALKFPDVLLSNKGTQSA